MKLTPTKVIVDENDIQFKVGDDKVVYETDVNAFLVNTGLTIQNIDLTLLEGYYLQLSSLGKTFSCGNLLDNIFLSLKIEEDNILLIIDFDGVEEVSESFFKSYTKFLLETSNKVITINMDTAISNAFSDFILERIIDITNEETGEEEE